MAEALYEGSSLRQWAFGRVVGHDTAESAEKAALRECNDVRRLFDSPKSKCVVKIIFERRCVASATHKDEDNFAFGWAVEDTKQAAETSALARCKARASGDASGCRVFSEGTFCDSVASGQQSEPSPPPAPDSPPVVRQPEPSSSGEFAALRRELDEAKSAAQTARYISLAVFGFSLIGIGAVTWWAMVRVRQARLAGASVGGALSTIFRPMKGRRAAASDRGRPELRLVPRAGGRAHLLDAQDLSGEGVTLGRADTCDIRLDDPRASSRHARIFHDETGRAMIEDLGSANGTFRNDQRIARASLKPGDVLRFGKSEFTVGE